MPTFRSEHIKEIQRSAAKVSGKKISADGMWGADTESAVSAAARDGFHLTFCKNLSESSSPKIETVDASGTDNLKVLNEAFKYLGTKEIRGSQHEQKILGFWDTIGLSGINDDETHWCAAFVGAVLERCGFKSTRSGRARSYLKWGKKVAANKLPPIGSIIVLSRGKNPLSGHVGFLAQHHNGAICDNNQKIHLLGGNQSNQVNISKYPMTSYLSARVGENWTLG